MRKSVFLILLFIAGPVFSECLSNSRGDQICGAGPCAIDGNGEVSCASHPAGSVILNDRGEVVCGLGECLKGPYGGNYCAIEPGGKTSLNARGEIECVGGCEAATIHLCEQRRESS